MLESYLASLLLSVPLHYTKSQVKPRTGSVQARFLIGKLTSPREAEGVICIMHKA